MSSELSMLRSLRRILESAAEGEGLARSIAEELRGSAPPGPDSARRVLLGYPLQASLGPLVESPSEEVAMLASLVVAAPRSSAALVGRSGEELAGTLERWVKARESRRLEQKVLRFRSVVTSGVLGAVTAMVASLGPLVGSLNFQGSARPVDPITLLVGAAVMAAVSSAVLGLFMSASGILFNVGVTLAVFAVVGAVALPLASLPAAAVWGVK